jgi:hypothetical protein
MADLSLVSSQPMKYQGVFGCLAVLLCWLNAAGAQIMEVRADGTACMHSGLSSNLSNCDVPEWYAYAFIGSISAVTEALGDDSSA